MNKKWWKMIAIIVVAALAVAVFIQQNAAVNADEDEEGWRLLAQGDLQGVARSGEGQVSIYERQDGSRLLRLTNFKAVEESDLRMVLVNQRDVSDNESVKHATRVDLGSIKQGSQGEGNQDFNIPTDVDLSQFPAVAIWNEESEENFLAAMLRYNE
ncbi:DM13 domain-containing protein [Desmospora activa]|uniref:Electron transfer DM13 n=1 Tax=Desmospora activa DSM 45169 TaxID=1121389 RepID=A0A2T4Z7M4_9BACL|nr:DM13 domain-containing protein [Desmospora activa]PTM57892.1 electron transfer DM13 [Desmospora activa DSM 45169]